MPEPRASPDIDEQQPVRSVLRALEVLVSVNELAPASVAQIVRQTSLPKATVIRLLSTLRGAGYLRRDPVSGHYQPLPAVQRLSSAWQSDDPFVSGARLQLNSLGQRLGWPAELMMAESDAMTIRASNRETSPISLRLFEQTRFPVLRSAGGLAWLAALAPGARQEAVIRLSESDSGPGSAQQRAATAFAAIEQTQRCGFSVHAYAAPVPGLRAIGVALPTTGPSPGALVLLTLENVVRMEALVADLVPAVMACARELAALYQRRNAR